MPKPKKVTRADGSIRWRVRFRDGNTNASEQFVDHKKAKDFCKLVDALGGTRARAAINEHTHEKVTNHTFGEAAALWWDWKNARRSDGTPLRVRAPQSLENYERLLRLHILPTFGAMPINLVTHDDVQAWVDSLASRRSAKTTADAHAVLHSVYSWAGSKSRELTVNNPCTETALPSRGRKSVKGVQPAEWAIIYEAAQELDPDAADLLLFLVNSGWRWSEAVAINTIDVDDFGDDGLWVTMGRVLRRGDRGRYEIVDDDGKSSAAMRRIRLGDHAADMVRRRITGRGPNDPVFTNRRGSRWAYSQFHGDVWTHKKQKTDGPNTRKRILQRAEELGLQRASEVKIHWLRHTHAALMLMSGEPMAAVQKRLGHEDIRTTVGVYGSLVSDVSESGLEAFDRILSGGTRQVATKDTPALPDAGA